jgi:8-oxo-dGTP diphosphatase
VSEETGLVVSSLKLLCISNIIDYGKHYLDIEFLAEVEPGQPQVLEPHLVESWDWYSFEDLPSPLFKADELAIRSYVTGQLYNP